MVSRRRNIVNYLEANKLFSAFQILDKRSGHSNDNYIVESEGQKYIVRLKKQNNDKYTRHLENEHHLLRFLEEKKIDFVPRSVFYDPENNIHILKYIEGRAIRFRHLSKAQMEQVVHKLHSINILAEDYEKYCQKKNIPKLQVQSELLGITQMLEEKIDEYKRGCGFSEARRWVKNHLKHDFDSYQFDKSHVFLNHGDPADNLIIKGSQIYIIDWEFVKVSYGPGIVHIIAHGCLDRQREKDLLKMYSEISALDYQELLYKTYMGKMAYYLLKITNTINLNKDKGQDPEERRELIKHLQSLYKKTKSRLHLQVKN